MAAKKNLLALFDVDGTLTPARKVLFSKVAALVWAKLSPQMASERWCFFLHSLNVVAYNVFSLLYRHHRK
jgi:FMN phosphatase YigB (HAD superfamily)